jgi:tetratricopeptide (TPR) repeat protein
VWLEDWSGSRPATYAARLANHHLQAGDTPDALRLLIANAQACVRAYATRDGYEGYGTAAELAQRWLDSGALQARVPLVQALVGRAETGLRVGELATALRMAQRAAELASQPGDSLSDQAQMDDLRVRARCLAGQILDSQGQPDEALAVLGQAVEDARLQPQGYGSSVYAISLIAMVLLRTGRLADAEALARQALLESQDRALQGDSQFAAGVGRLHTWLGHALARRGDHSQAQQQYLRGLAAFRQSGDEFAAVMTELSLGNLAWRAHQLEDAERTFRQVWLRCQAQDEVLGAATAQANLGQVLLDRGKPAEALEMLVESERSQRRMGRLEVLAETLRLQGLALHALGRLEEARAAVARAVAHAEKTGQSALMAAAKETMTGLK